MARRVFTKEFKASAIKLVMEQSSSVQQAAANLGINPTTLQYWLTQHRRHDGAAAVQEDHSLRKRVRELEAANQRLTMEREILKKAAAFFAREPQS